MGRNKPENASVHGRCEATTKPLIQTPPLDFTALAASSAPSAVRCRCSLVTFLPAHSDGRRCRVGAVLLGHRGRSHGDPPTCR
jgi:hypothetical protein